MIVIISERLLSSLYNYSTSTAKCQTLIQICFDCIFVFFIALTVCIYYCAITWKEMKIGREHMNFLHYFRVSIVHQKFLLTHPVYVSMGYIHYNNYCVCFWYGSTCPNLLKIQLYIISLACVILFQYRSSQSNYLKLHAL